MTGGRSVRRVGGTSVFMIAAAAGLGAFGPASAQWEEGPSVLSLLPVAGSLALDASVTGSLGAGDYVSGGQKVVAYAYTGEEGEPLIIDLVSDDFDAFLTLLDPDGREVETDDDSGGACHARIATFLEHAGTYRIVASSLSGGSGEFTLSLGNRMGPRDPEDCGGGYYDEGELYGDADDLLDVIAELEPQGTLSLGGMTEASGELSVGDGEMSDRSFVEAWLVEGEPGTTVWIDLVSRSFDTLLFVVDLDGRDYATDDDSGGACNSRMQITLGEEPTVLVVNALSAGGSGPFTLRVSETEGPEAMGACPGLLEQSMD